MATQFSNYISNKGRIVGNIGGASPTGYYVESKLLEMFQQSAKQQLNSSSPASDSSLFLSPTPSSVSASYNEFHVAACLGSQFTISELLSLAHVHEINQQDRHGNSPLHWAASEGHASVVKILLENGAEPDVQNFAGETPLFIAASLGSYDTCLFLLKFNANPNLANIEGATPLHMAIANGHVEVAKILLQCGAFLHAQDDEGDTILHYAVRENQYELLSSLISSYPSLLPIKNEDEETAYDLAESIKDSKMIQLFKSLVQY